MLDQIKKLLEVKSILSLCAAVVFVILSLKGVFQPNEIMNVILIVFTFYLSRSSLSSEKKLKNKEGDNNNE